MRGSKQAKEGSLKVADYLGGFGDWGSEKTLGIVSSWRDWGSFGSLAGLDEASTRRRRTRTGRNK